MTSADANPVKHSDGYLYRRLFGDAWVTVPEPIRDTYFTGAPLTLTGRMRVTTGRSLTARLCRRFLNLPKHDADVAVRLDITGGPAIEHWRRTIGDWSLATTQRGAGELMVERNGLLDYHFSLSTWGRGVRHTQEAVYLSVLGLHVRLPRWAAPHVTGFQVVAPPPNAFAISVIIEAPNGALLVAYEGRIRREEG